jgi:hypothetical protein
VAERRRAHGNLDANIRIIKETIGDPYIAELFEVELDTVVEKARELHRVLDREEQQLARARRAAEAREVLTDWVSRFNVELPASTDNQEDLEAPDNPYRISEEDSLALWRIQESIDYRIRVASQDVHRRLGATRQTGGAREREKDQREREKDQRAAQFAIGELAYWVKKVNPSKPQNTTLAAVAEALFDPDGSVFVTTRRIEDEPAGKPKSLVPKDIEHFREAHAKIVREGGAIGRWDDLFDATWPPPEPPPRSRKRKSGSTTSGS